MQQEQQCTLIAHDLMDTQLVTKDQRRAGRVTDIKMEWHEDGRLFAVAIVTGPQATAARLSRSCKNICRWLWRDRFEHHIPVGEIEEVGTTVHLRKREDDYSLGYVERWIGEHLLRWIPGNNR